MKKRKRRPVHPALPFPSSMAHSPLSSINSVGNFATWVFNPVLSPFPPPTLPSIPLYSRPIPRLTQCAAESRTSLTSHSPSHSDLTIHSEGTRWAKCGVSHPTFPTKPVKPSHSLSSTALPKTHDPCHHGLQQLSLREKHTTHKGLQGSFKVYTGTPPCATREHRSRLPSARQPRRLISLSPYQNYGLEVQKDIDTVNDYCFACRAAAARRVPT